MDKLKNPYADLPYDERCQLHIDISKEDREYLRSVYPVQGAMIIVAGYLIHGLCSELRKMRHHPTRVDVERLLERRSK